MPFPPHTLFGGAIVARLPSTYFDASNLREVPSNQEVWIDAVGYSSIIIEILERVEGDDEITLEEHAMDLVEEGEQIRSLGVQRVLLSRMINIPTYCKTLTTTPAPLPPDSTRKQPVFTHIHLLLLRLAAQKADILISINAPHYAEESEPATQGGAVTELVTQAAKAMEEVLETFEVLDWGLFDGDEEASQAEDDVEG